MREPRWLSRGAVVAFQEQMLADHGGSAGLRVELLESALAKSQNLFANGNASLSVLAASYGSGIIHNHPFIDGNKRAGFVAAAAFLDVNGFELTASEADAAAVTLALAAGEMSEPEYAAWIENNSRKIPS